MAGGGADYFGPQEPIPAMMPLEVAGRIRDFEVGFNLQNTPRAYESTSFAEMRGLADSYTILRLAIETRKDQMERLTWSIKPAVLANGEPAAKDDDPAIQEIADFFKCPDGRHRWGVWLRRVLEDMFVIDAVSIYCQRTRGQKLTALQQIDGSVIAPLIDDWGCTPEAPAPAYREVLKGMPAVYYTQEDLIYAPRNPRVHKVYGFSPVEQIIMIVNIGLRRELSTLMYWTEGNMPEALIGVPKEWTPEQIAKFQGWFDALLEGNLAARRHMKFVPEGMKLMPTKEPELWAKFDEWLARVVCFAFSLPPTPFVQQVNRATAQSAHDAALEEGLAPLQLYVKSLVDEVIRRFWPAKAGKLEFTWDDDREIDAAVQETVLTGYASKAVYTINEVRDILGKAPMEGGDKLMVLTASGYVDINAPPPEPAPAIGAGGAPAGQKGPVADASQAKPGKAKTPTAAKLAKVTDDARRNQRARKVGKIYWGPARTPVAPHTGGDTG
jgi:Phage portal protein